MIDSRILRYAAKWFADRLLTPGPFKNPHEKKCPFSEYFMMRHAKMFIDERYSGIRDYFEDLLLERLKEESKTSERIELWTKSKKHTNLSDVLLETCIALDIDPFYIPFDIHIEIDQNGVEITDGDNTMTKIVFRNQNTLPIEVKTERSV